MRFFVISFLAVTVAVTSAHNTTSTVEDVLTDKGHFTILLDLLRTAELLDTLNNAASLTLFAPDDSAFDGVDVEELKAHPRQLSRLLKYHVTATEIYHIRIAANDMTLPSLYDGQPIRINRYPLVKRHSAQGVLITEDDLETKNGYIHTLAGIMKAPEGNVVDILASRPDTTIVSSLLNTAGEAGTLRADKNVTFFAPNDAAFAKISQEIQKYYNETKHVMEETLLYHAVDKKTIYTVGIQHYIAFDSANKHDDELMLFEKSDGSVFVNDAKIIERDISGTNGVIHIIDKVLIPARFSTDLEDLGIDVIG